MLADPQDPQGLVDAEAPWVPDASICAYLSTVGPDGRGPRKSSKDWRRQKLQGLQTVVDFERARRIRGCRGLVGDSPFWTGPQKLTEASRASHGRGLETCYQESWTPKLFGCEALVNRTRGACGDPSDACRY